MPGRIFAVPSSDGCERPCRQAFVKEGDNVNLYWLQRTLDGEKDLGKLARDSGRDVKEFYAATTRRKRIVARLLAEDNGVKHDPGEKPR